MSSLNIGLSSSLRIIMGDFAARITAINRNVRFDIIESSNATYIMRMYLAFRTCSGADEVAITVDATFNAKLLYISSDVCSGAGRIIAVGPGVNHQKIESQPNADDLVGTWLRRFSEFLTGSEDVVLREIGLLT